MKAANDILERHLKTSEERSDTSLRGNALRRALGDDLPKTLTPYEWEERYAEHGVPDGHRLKDPPAESSCSSWKRWFTAGNGNE